MTDPSITTTPSVTGSPSPGRSNSASIRSMTSSWSADLIAARHHDDFARLPQRRGQLATGPLAGTMELADDGIWHLI
jgi:hypothetical protein